MPFRVCCLVESLLFHCTRCWVAANPQRRLSAAPKSLWYFAVCGQRLRGTFAKKVPLRTPKTNVAKRPSGQKRTAPERSVRSVTSGSRGPKYRHGEIERSVSGALLRIVPRGHPPPQGLGQSPNIPEKKVDFRGLFLLQPCFFARSTV